MMNDKESNERYKISENRLTDDLEVLKQGKLCSIRAIDNIEK